MKVGKGLIRFNGRRSLRKPLSSLRSSAGGRPHPSGQAMLLSVLVMLLVALMGATFVGLISFNLTQSARHEDVVRADQLAKAGIEFADQQLTNGTQGADWRPQDSLGDASVAASRAATAGYYDDIETERGWADGAYIKYPDPENPAPGNLANPDFSGGRFLLKVEYPGGAPGSQTAPFIKITSIGRSTGNPAVFKLDVAYKPAALADNLLFVTHKDDTKPNKVDTTKTAFLGTAPRINFDAETMLSNAADAATSGNAFLRVRNKGGFTEGQTIYVDIGSDAGGAKKETKVIATGGLYNGSDDRIDLTTALARSHTANAPVSGTDPDSDPSALTYSIFNGPIFVNGNVQWFGNTTLNLASSRLDQAQVAGLINSDAINARSLTINVNGNPATVSGPGTPDPGNSNTFTDVTAGGLPVYVDARGRINNDRSLSDRWVTPITPPEFVTGDVSTQNVKWIRYADLTKYSDNTLLGASGLTRGATGFGAGIYIGNTTDIQYASLPTAQQRLTTLTTEWQTGRNFNAADGGWVNMLEYVPKGVEIVVRNDENVLNPSGNLVSLIGQTQHPYSGHANASLAFPGSGAPHVSGSWVIWIRRTDKDGGGNPAPTYDSTGAQLPAGTIQTFDYPANGIILAGGNVRIRGNLPQSTSARNYSLTVASGGTIYIEGNLLTPTDRGETLGAGNSNGHIALLAKDHLCLNTTQFHHRRFDGANPGPASPNNPVTSQGNDSQWLFNTAQNMDRESSFGAPSSTAYLTVRYGGELQMKYTGNGTSAAAEIESPGVNKRLRTNVIGATDGSGPLNVDLTANPTDTLGGLNTFLNAQTGYKSITAPTGYVGDPTLCTSLADIATAANPADIDFWGLWLPLKTNVNLTWGGTAVLDSTGTTTPNPTIDGDGSFPGRYLSFQLPGAFNTGQAYKLSLASNTTNNNQFRLERFKVEQFDTNDNVRQGMDIIVSALMYAQEGTVFVIPGYYFDDSTKTATGSADGAVRFRRYDYHVRIHGAVAQNYTVDENSASPDVYTFNTTQWTDKWSYPTFNTGVTPNRYDWHSIEYQYDLDLRTAVAGMLPIPKLPLAAGLVYVS